MFIMYWNDRLQDRFENILYVYGTRYKPYISINLYWNLYWKVYKYLGHNLYYWLFDFRANEPVLEVFMLLKLFNLKMTNEGERVYLQCDPFDTGILDLDNYPTLLEALEPEIQPVA